VPRYNWDMEKKRFLEMFKNATPGSVVEVVFVGPAAKLSGAYTLKGTRAGRGKGGSLCVDLLDAQGQPLPKIPNPSTANPEHLSEFGSGVTHLIGTIKVGDVGSGSLEEANLGLIPKDALRASQVTEALRPLVGTSGLTIKIESVKEDLNGTFTLLSCEACRGRVPQLLLKLRRDDGLETDLYTYRHAQFLTDVVC
jgi:hypothetical protein